MSQVKRLAAVRERTEDLERASLSTWATLSLETKGRDRHEDPDALRTTFQVDRDRIVGADAFRGLAGKTQTFVAVAGVRGVRVRLSHALEVAQVARTIARGLRLNEDLVEAIALGHDLGQPPFGAAGEEALSVLGDGVFRHNEQSLRVVELLEADGGGLNLTWEVRDGILNHTKASADPATLEGQVVREAVRIATLNYDLAAALDAGLVFRDALPAVVTNLLGDTPGRRITTAMVDVVQASLDQPDIGMSRPVADAHAALAEFVARHVHDRPAARDERNRAVHTLRSLLVYLLENPSTLPSGTDRQGDLEARVLDAVSGMTDSEALDAFARFFLPGSEPGR